VIAAALGVIVALALARPALADDANAGPNCRAIRHGTDEFAVCLYRDAADFDDVPYVGPERAIAFLDAFLAAPDDAICVKPATGEKPYVQCYFRRDVFEADEGNPAWSTMGPESDLAQAVLYSPNELTPLESSESTPAASPEAVPAEPRLSPAPTESAPEPSPAPQDVAPTTARQPSEMPIPSPDPSAPAEPPAE
jgi:hypothetical protein